MKKELFAFFCMILITIVLAVTLFLSGTIEAEAESKPGKCICGESVQQDFGPKIIHCKCGTLNCVIATQAGVSCK